MNNKTSIKEERPFDKLTDEEKESVRQMHYLGLIDAPAKQIHEKDKFIDDELHKLGYVVYRIWEHEKFDKVALTEKLEYLLKTNEEKELLQC